MITHLPSESTTFLRNEAELVQRISEELPAETWRQYRYLVERLHAGILTTERHQALISLTDEIEIDHAYRLGLVLELARLRGTSLETQMQELRFPRHLYQTGNERQRTSD